MTYPLRSLQLFACFSETDSADLVRFMRERRFAAGERVCALGDHGSSMLLVTQGALSAIVFGRGNEPREIARLSQGSVFGEMFCIDPAPRPVTLVAVTPTTVLELGRDEVARMRREAPHAAAALVSAVFRDVMRRLRSVDDRIGRELREDAVARGSPEPASATRKPLPPSWERCFATLRGST